MKDNQLPIGWCSATLGAVCTDPQYGYTTKASDSGTIKLLRTTDITKGKINWNTVPFCSESPSDPEKYLLSKGDIIISRAGSVGVSYLVNETENAVFASYLIRFKPLIDKTFFRYFLDSPIYWSQITEHKLGIAVPNVNASKLKEIEFGLPPLNEQKRIVARIEALFPELDNGVAALKTAREQLKVYRQAVLKHAFEGKLTAQWRKDNADKLESPEQLLARIQQEREARYQQQLEEWKDAVKAWEDDGKDGRKPNKPKAPEQATLEEAEFQIPNNWATTKLGLIAEVSGGLTKNQKRNALPLKMKYLRVANVYADRLSLDDVQEIGVSEAEAKKVALFLNDLLVVEGNGSVEQIGRVSLWDASVQNCGHQNHLIRVRLDNPEYARFVLLFLLSPIGRELIVKEASSTSGLHTLSISKVSNLQVPLCSLSEASAVMKIVDKKITLTEKLENEIETELQRAETLRQSILKKAFSGQLVPQDPNDEPASELLARIQAEKAARKAETKAAAKPKAARKPRTKGSTQSTEATL